MAPSFVFPAAVCSLRSRLNQTITSPLHLQHAQWGRNSCHLSTSPGRPQALCCKGAAIEAHSALEVHLCAYCACLRRQPLSLRTTFLLSALFQSSHPPRRMRSARCLIRMNKNIEGDFCSLCYLVSAYASLRKSQHRVDA